MARSREIKILITGNAEDAKRAFRSVEAGSSRMNNGIKRAAKIGIAGLASLAVAGVAFGVASVKSYAEAQTAQLKLSEAFRKFPALADTNIAALGRLNTALMAKTRFDDEAFAAGQATLAQYGLTGAEITKLTPLVADYAARTGKDIPDAAGILGKALLGKGKALAAIGIKFKDAGSVAANYDQIVAGLRTQVGGFAEREGKTAAGSLEILKNVFGEVKESVGAALMPALQALMPVITALVPVIGTALGGVAKALAPLLLRLARALGPVMTKVVAALTPVLDVMGAALGDILIAVLPLIPVALEMARAFVPIIPPLAKIITLLVKMLVPILTPLIGLISSMAGVLANVLAHALEIIAGLLRPLVGVFENIGNAIAPVIRFVRRLADTISKFKLPDWLIPGSPTPLETGLHGIAGAFREAAAMSRKLALPEAASLAVGGGRVALAGAAAGAGAAAAGITINFNGPVWDRARAVEDIRRELVRKRIANVTGGV